MSSNAQPLWNDSSSNYFISTLRIIVAKNSFNSIDTKIVAKLSRDVREF